MHSYGAVLIGFAAVAAASVGSANPSHAQAPPAEPQATDQRRITAEEAIAIARRHGVFSVEDVDRGDGKWEVEGKDAQGREIEVEIDIRSGRILKIERD